MALGSLAVPSELVRTDIEGFTVVGEIDLGPVRVLSVALERVVPHIGILSVVREAINGTFSSVPIAPEVVLGINRKRRR